MKKYLIILLVAISTSFFVGCDSDDEFTPPNYVTFASEEMTFTVDQNSSGSFDVTVFTANKVGSDRTFSINVNESSTINEGDFSVPGTVTVPANSNEATFTVEVTDNTIADEGESLDLSLSGEQGLFTGEPLEINVLKRCEFESLAPGYTVTTTAFGSEAPEFETTLNDEGDMVFTSDNLWGDFVAWAAGDSSLAGAYPFPATITMDADNNLDITSEADYMLGGDGSYNPCTGSFSMSLETSIFGDPNVIVDVVFTPSEGPGDNGEDEDEDE